MSIHYSSRNQQRRTQLDAHLEPAVVSGRLPLPRPERKLRHHHRQRHRPSFYNVRTLNDLYGFQIGGRYRRCCHRFFWDVTGKAGVFGNAAEQSQYLSDNGQHRPSTATTPTNHEGTVAFIGDINVSVGFQLNCVWAARCGYNLLWIDQVALAPDQLNFDISSPGNTNTHTSGDVFLQGINVALEARW